MFQYALFWVALSLKVGQFFLKFLSAKIGSHLKDLTVEAYTN
jgi:hypothetical protein